MDKYRVRDGSGSVLESGFDDKMKAKAWRNSNTAITREVDGKTKVVGYSGYVGRGMDHPNGPTVGPQSTRGNGRKARQRATKAEMDARYKAMDQQAVLDSIEPPNDKDRRAGV